MMIKESKQKFIGRAVSRETLFSVLTTRSDTNRAIKATEGGHWLEAYLDLGGRGFVLLVSKKDKRR